LFFETKKCPSVNKGIYQNSRKKVKKRIKKKNEKKTKKVKKKKKRKVFKFL